MEAVPDLFPEGAVDFAFEGPLRFKGISLLLPKDVGDPVDYAKERLGILAPSYIYSDLKIRKTALDEASPQTIEILAPPAF